MDVDLVSRIALAVAGLASSIGAGVLAVVTHPKYTPHMVLVSFWSLLFGLGMVDLAFGGFHVFPDQFFVVGLNSSATIMTGGWAVFGMRFAWQEHKMKQINNATILVVDPYSRENGSDGAQRATKKKIAASSISMTGSVLLTEDERQDEAFCDECADEHLLDDEKVTI